MRIIGRPPKTPKAIQKMQDMSDEEFIKHYNKLKVQSGLTIGGGGLLLIVGVVALIIILSSMR